MCIKCIGGQYRTLFKEENTYVYVVELEMHASFTLCIAFAWSLPRGIPCLSNEFLANGSSGVLAGAAAELLSAGSKMQVEGSDKVELGEVVGRLVVFIEISRFSLKSEACTAWLLGGYHSKVKE